MGKSVHSDGMSTYSVRTCVLHLDLVELRKGLEHVGLYSTLFTSSAVHWCAVLVDRKLFLLSQPVPKSSSQSSAQIPSRSDKINYINIKLINAKNAREQLFSRGSWMPVLVLVSIVCLL